MQNHPPLPTANYPGIPQHQIEHMEVQWMHRLHHARNAASGPSNQPFHHPQNNAGMGPMDPFYNPAPAYPQHPPLPLPIPPPAGMFMPQMQPTAYGPVYNQRIGQPQAHFGPAYQLPIGGVGAQVDHEALLQESYQHRQAERLERRNQRHRQNNSPQPERPVPQASSAYVEHLERQNLGHHQHNPPQPERPFLHAGPAPPQREEDLHPI